MRLLLMVAIASASSGALAQNVYFGNLHAHTSYSDGRGVPDDAFKAAREAGLDFFAITEHNHAAGDGKGDANDGIVIAEQPQLYSGAQESLVSAAGRHTADGSFVAIYGQEFSTISRGNHVNVFDVPAVLRSGNGEFARLLDEIRPLRDVSGSVPLVQFNHPRIQRSGDLDYGRDDFGGDDRAWVAAMDPVVELIELLNAPALSDGEGFRSDRNETEYFRYLNMGFHISPSAGHDNHYRNWGRSTDARIAVIAPELTRASLLRAMRARHTYATEDKNLRVIFRANGALGGDIVAPPAPGSELMLSVEIRDDDAEEAQARYRIDVFGDQPGGEQATAPIETFEVDGNTAAPLNLEGVPFLGAGSFVLLRITQFRSDEHDRDDRVWTAPVWFEAASTMPSAPLLALRIAALLPNPPGDERVNEAVTLRNGGSTPITLSGWQLRDLAGKIWPLGDATVGAGAEVTLRRNGQPLSLNNGRETVELIDPQGEVVQTVEYSQAAEGEVIRPQV